MFDGSPPPNYFINFGVGAEAYGVDVENAVKGSIANEGKISASAVVDVKRTINVSLGSEIVEEKQYATYRKEPPAS